MSDIITKALEGAQESQERLGVAVLANLQPYQIRLILSERALVVATEKQIMDLTGKLDEHPEEWDGPCNCALCRSYD